MSKPGRFLALVAIIAVIAPRYGAACALDRLATVPLTLIDGHILLDVAVNGRRAVFQLDTGAARSLVTPDAARRLGLARDRWIGASVEGIGGIQRRSVADTTSLTLGGVALRHRDPVGDALLIVAAIAAPTVGGHAIDGLLGRDFLSAFDIALDVPARFLSIWRVRGCAGRFPPPGILGPAGYDAVDALAAYGDALVLPVRADGVALRALPDTGSTGTLITESGMIRLGSRPAGPSVRVGGVGTMTRPGFPLRLSSLVVGATRARDVTALGSSLRIAPIVDMLLGADWFATHWVWLSYATRQVFIARPMAQPP